MKSHASMNRIFRLVWNATLNLWVAVAENAKGRGKGGSSRSRVEVESADAGSAGRGGRGGLAGLCPSMLSLLGACALLVGQAHAAPVGGQVVAGAGAISQSGATTVITQATNRLAIDWNTFSTSAGESINFIQPNAQAIALNRITGSSPSSLLGSLSANGQVFILNPNGVLFGAGAQVTVGGLVASTLGVGNADFMGGVNTFTKATGSTGSVVNQGALTAAPGGYVALLAPEVRNEGVISATRGTVLLGAGNQVTLNLNNGSLLSYSIDQGALNALADNQQLIQADGGQIILSAQALDAVSRASVNNSGTLEARTLQHQSGRILLLGDMAVGTVHVAGKLDASAPNLDGKSGNGGFIETSAAHVQVADTAVITTLAAASGTGRSGTWLIDPTDYTIAPTDPGDGSSYMSGATLSSSLNGANVVIQTLTSGSGNGDILVNDAVNWNAATSLTLSAARNININRSITATNASGSLALQYGQGAVAVGNTATYNVNAPINLQAGNNFSTTLGSDGLVNVYTVITALGAEGSTTATDLQGINGGLAGSYVLGSNIDATGTSGWSAGAGFSPIGNLNAAFTGTFDGLGHTISGLIINRSATDYVGLFGYIDSGALIRNVGLVGGSVMGQSYTGPLVGDERVASISNSYAAVDVSGANYVGGLVGYNSRGITSATNADITNSYATGQVNGMGNYIGGLAGVIEGNLSNSYATGAVTGVMYVGGLAGVNSAGSISNSYAMGHVSGSYRVGGILGIAYGSSSLSNSYWNTETSGTGSSYGGTGLTTAQMQTASSFSTWDIANSGGSGKTWRIYEGHTAPLLTSFMTGLTLADTAVVYNGTAQSANTANTPIGVLGAAATKAGTYLGYYSTQQGFDISGGNLVIAPAPLTVSATAASKIYDGQLTAGGQGTVGTLAGAGAGDSVGSAGGQVFLDKNAGSNKIVRASGVTVQDGHGVDISANYAISYVDDTTSTITPAAVVVTANAASKTYDGGLTAPGSGSVGSLVSGDLVSNVGSQAFLDKNAGSSKVVRASGVMFWDASHMDMSGNYAISYVDNSTGTILQAALTVTATAASKTYDGQLTAPGQGWLSALGTGDSVNSAGSQMFLDKNAGTGKVVRASGVTIKDGSNADMSGNYAISYVDDTTSAIYQAALTVTATAASKTYDGQLSATGTQGTLSALVNGDSVNSVGSQVFLDKNAGSGKSVRASGVTVQDASGADMSANYLISYVDDNASTISPAALTVTAMAASKTYDGFLNASGQGTRSSLVAGDLVNSVGSQVFLDKNAGAGKLVRASGVTVQDASGADMSANYAISYLDNTTSTITPAPLTVTANVVNKIYDGTWIATPQGTLSGLVASDSAGSLGSEVFLNRNAGSGKVVRASGVTVIDASAMDMSANYAITYVDNSVSTIAPAALMLAASAATRLYGAANPGLTGSVTGFVNGETLASATAGSAMFSTAATRTSNVGAYAVAGTGLSANNGNYVFQQAAANSTALVVTKAALTVSANDTSKLADSAVYTGGNGVVYGGFVVGDTSAVLTGSLLYGGSAQGASLAGAYVIALTGQSASNYNLAFGSGVLTIKPGNATESALGSPMLVPAYNSVLNTAAVVAPPPAVASNAAASAIRVDATARVASIQAAPGLSKTSPGTCGVSLPEGASCGGEVALSAAPLALLRP